MHPPDGHAPVLWVLPPPTQPGSPDQRARARGGMPWSWASGRPSTRYQCRPPCDPRVAFPRLRNRVGARVVPRVCRYFGTTGGGVGSASATVSFQFLPAEAHYGKGIPGPAVPPEVRPQAPFCATRWGRLSSRCARHPCRVSLLERECLLAERALGADLPSGVRARDRRQSCGERAHRAEREARCTIRAQPTSACWLRRRWSGGDGDDERPDDGVRPKCRRQPDARGALAARPAQRPEVTAVDLLARSVIRGFFLA
jgi:hypothetical protein